MTYEYIKGVKVLSEEHMLSATEIAATIGVCTENGRPNALLVSSLIKQYIHSNNLQIYDYYYVYSKGCVQVYPMELWTEALSHFVYDNMNSPVNEVREYEVDIEGKKKTIKYKTLPGDNMNGVGAHDGECVIINFSDYKKKK